MQTSSPFFHHNVQTSFRTSPTDCSIDCCLCRCRCLYSLLHTYLLQVELGSGQGQDQVHHQHSEQLTFHTNHECYSTKKSLCIRHFLGYLPRMYLLLGE